MMASFVPKPVSINPSQGSNKTMISGSGVESSILTSGNFTQSPAAPTQQSSMYDNSPRAIATSDKKLNGTLVSSPAIPVNQQVQHLQSQLQGRQQNMISASNGSNSSGNGGNIVQNNNFSNAANVEAVSPEVLAGSGTRVHPQGSVANPNTGRKPLLLT